MGIAVANAVFLLLNSKSFHVLIDLAFIWPFSSAGVDYGGRKEDVYRSVEWWGGTGRMARMHSGIRTFTF